MEVSAVSDVVVKRLTVKLLPLKQTVSPAFPAFAWDALVALTVHFGGVIGRTPTVPSVPCFRLSLIRVDDRTGTTEGPPPPAHAVAANNTVTKRTVFTKKLLCSRVPSARSGIGGDMGDAIVSFRVEVVASHRFSNSIVVTGGQLGVLFDAVTGRQLYQHRSPLNCAAQFTGVNGTTCVVVGAYTGEGVVLELQGDGTLQHRTTLRLHDNAVKGLAVSGDSIFSVCADTGASWFDTSTLRETQTS